MGKLVEIELIHSDINCKKFVCIRVELKVDLPLKASIFLELLVSLPIFCLKMKNCLIFVIIVVN